MITNKNKTVIAPTYIIINIIDINSTSEINNNPVELVKTNIKKNAEYIVFVEYITNIADVNAILEKKKKKIVSKFINYNIKYS
jgi:hypothetical protein